MLGRATLVLALLIGFYVFAMAIVVTLLAIPYFDWSSNGRIHGKLAVACVVGAGAIILAVIPRRDAFEAPGPSLTSSSQPRLFAMIHEIAEATRQAIPVEVYLLPDVNAFVTQRGGYLGLGSRRVMGIGLPLVHLLTESELRGVIAHEFGHFHGGDVKLGPWVYQTRAAIRRALESVGDSILRAPFSWYSKLFLRLSHAVSRRQEYAADALAASIVGASPLIDGLKKTRGLGSAFDPYVEREVLPVLNRGYRPPLLEGFDRFIAQPWVAAKAQEILDTSMQQDSDPYDTHPALPERIAALRGSAEEPDGLTAPSVGLLADVAELEQQLYRFMFGDGAATQPAIAWAMVGEQVLMPMWREAVRDSDPHLPEGFTPKDLPVDTDEVISIGRRILGAGPGKPRMLDAAVFAIGAGLALALERSGFELSAGVGENTVFTKGPLRVEPFAVLPELLAGEKTRAQWHAECAELGIADTPIASLAS